MHTLVFVLLALWRLGGESGIRLLRAGNADDAASRARARLTWTCTFLIALAACSTSTPGPGLDSDRRVAHVDRLTSIGPRPKDSDGSRTAAGYIEDELDRLGVVTTRAPVGDVELPAITVLGSTYRRAHRVSTTDPNLLVRFGPPGDALLIMAHYDTVAGSPGAADNAAAVATLLDLARTLRDQPPAQPVLLAFTANEEIGLVGAEALAAQRSDIAFAIALDLIGGDGPLVINGASKLIGRAELAWLAAAADRAGIALTAPPAHRVVSRWWPQSERSDHGPFTRRGVRAIHLYNRGNDGDWIDLAYHSARDVPVRLHRDSLANLGRLLRALVAAPPPAHAGDGFWLPLATNSVVPRWLLVACELALLLVVVIALVLSRDGIVAAIANRHERATARRGPALLVGAACYALAMIAACALERGFSRGHPAPWLHAPLRALIGNALVLAGWFGLATRVVARFRPWVGDQRYRALASIVCAAIGTLLLVIGAAELAWIWLVPAAIIAIVPARAALVGVAFAALPIACVLHPLQLREAAWNGFLPLSLPLSAWLGMLGIPSIATIAWWLRRCTPTGPLGTLVLGVGCGLAVIVGLVFAITYEPACSAAKFETFHLGCERV
jgi:hypothetical protein